MYSVVFLPQIFADAAAQREILSLTVLCGNKSKGCLWKGELRDIKVSGLIQRPYFEP